MSSQEQELRCSFCSKSQHDVRKLIAGPSVNICNECIDVCYDIIADAALAAEASEASPNTADEAVAISRSFQIACTVCRLPVVIDEALGIEERGFLCAGCADAVEAAIAMRRG
jgi:hypothetical protein